jgi:hypothetical protein
MKPPTDIDFPIAFHLVAHIVGPRSAEADAAVLDNCSSYVEAHEEHLRWLVDDRRGRFRPFDQELWEEVEGFRDDAPDAPARYWMAHGGETKLTPSVWSLYGSLDGRPSNDLELRWPVEHWNGRWATAVDEVKARLSGRPLFQGRAGFSFAEVSGEECYQKHRAALALRFQGVDIAEISSGSIWAERGLGSVNWLTAIGNVFVEKLGGRKAFAALGDDILVHDLGTGLLVQAGEKPSLGDVNAGDTLPLYREVAKFIMPVRYHGNVIWANVPLADAKAWVARFDP